MCTGWQGCPCIHERSTSAPHAHQLRDMHCCRALTAQMQHVCGKHTYASAPLTNLMLLQPKPQSEQQRRVMEVEDRLVRTERELSSRIRDLESTLDSAQKDADAVREVAQKLEAERDDARAAAAAVGTPNGARMARRGSMGSAASLSSMDNGVLGGNGKWQVGGGGWVGTQ